MVRQSSINRESAVDAELLSPPTQEVAGIIELPEGMDPRDYDRDSEAAWDKLIEELHASKGAGKITAYKVPLDKDGKVNLSRGTAQTYLGAWQHDQYEFDDLIAMIIRDFFEPGERAAIRLIGTRTGAKGIKVNRVIPVQRPATAMVTTQPSSQLADALNAVQSSNRATMEMVERLLARNSTPEAPKKSTMEWARDIAVILTPFVPVLVAAVSKGGAPKSDLSQMILALKELKGLTGDEKESDDEDSTTVSIIKAVAGPGMQLLNTLAQRSSAQNVNRRPLRSAVVHQPTPSAPQSGVPVQVAPAISTESAHENADRISSEKGLSKTTTENPMLAQLASQLDQLASLAEQDADVKEVAKLVLQMLPEEMDGQLFELLQDKEGFERLHLLSPRMKQHAAWFESLRIAILAEYEDEPGEVAAKS